MAYLLRTPTGLNSAVSLSSSINLFSNVGDYLEIRCSIRNTNGQSIVGINNSFDDFIPNYDPQSITIPTIVTHDSTAIERPFAAAEQFHNSRQAAELPTTILRVSKARDKEVIRWPAWAYRGLVNEKNKD